jgi:hypothetical protein
MSIANNALRSDLLAVTLAVAAVPATMDVALAAQEVNIVDG